jgi:outer membrane protein TolC
LQTNPSALAAEEQYKQAQAMVREAQAQQHFQLTFNSQAGVSNATVIQPPPSSENFGALQNSLTVPIPLGPKASLAVSQARYQLSAAADTYHSSRLALAEKVAAAYFDLLKKRALVDAAQLDLTTSQRELTDAQARNKAGDIPQLDVLQAQVPVAADQAALLSSQSAADESLETVNDLLGRPLDQPLTLDDSSSPPSAPKFTIVQARSMALTISPDVAAADAAVKAAETARDLAKRYNDPTLSLQAIDLRSGDKTSFSREDTVQAAVTVPLGDGGLGKAALQTAASAVIQAQRQADASRKSVTLAVSAAYLEVQNSLSEVAAAAAARDIAQTTYDKTRLGYENGLYPLVDALTSEKAAADARSAYIQALYDASSAGFTLYTDIYGLEPETTDKKLP